MARSTGAQHVHSNHAIDSVIRRLPNCRQVQGHDRSIGRQKLAREFRFGPVKLFNASIAGRSLQNAGSLGLTQCVFQTFVKCTETRAGIQQAQKLARSQRNRQQDQSPLFSDGEFPAQGRCHRRGGGVAGENKARQDDCHEGRLNRRNASRRTPTGYRELTLAALHSLPPRAR